MDLWIIRARLFAAILVSGYLVRPFGNNLLLTLSLSAALGVVVLLAEMRLRRLSVKTLLGAAVGSILGIMGAALISMIIGRMDFEDPHTGTFIQILVLIVMTYVGLLAGASKGEHLAAIGGVFSAEVHKGARYQRHYRRACGRHLQNGIS